MEGPWQVMSREGSALAHFESEIDARVWAIYYLHEHPDEIVFVACDREYLQQNEHVLRERPSRSDAFWTSERLLVLTHMEESLEER